MLAALMPTIISAAAHQLVQPICKPKHVLKEKQRPPLAVQSPSHTSVWNPEKTDFTLFSTGILGVEGVSSSKH